MKHLCIVFHVRSNFLIGRGVASCCAALQHPQWGETLAHQRERKGGKKCDELWILRYAAASGVSKPFFFSEYLSTDTHCWTRCTFFYFLLHNSNVFLRMAFKVLPQWLGFIQRSSWDMYSSCKYDYKCGRYMHRVMRCMHVHRENA